MFLQYWQERGRKAPKSPYMVNNFPLKALFYGCVCAIYCPKCICDCCCLFCCHFWKCNVLQHEWYEYMYVCIIIQPVVGWEIPDLSPVSWWNVPMAKNPGVERKWLCIGDDAAAFSGPSKSERTHFHCTNETTEPLITLNKQTPVVLKNMILAFKMFMWQFLKARQGQLLSASS